jgi:hypothetical protein
VGLHRGARGLRVVYGDDDADVIGVLDAAKALGFTRIAMQTVVE